MAKVSRSKLAKAYVSMLGGAARPNLNAALAELVVKNRLTKEVDLLIQDIKREMFGQRGHLEVDVVSARGLSQEIIGDIKKMLTRVTGAKTVAARTSVQPDLLGGVVINTPEVSIDLSIRSSLSRLEV